jgi:RNA polymerase sigma factor (sigma-70 family)
MSDPPIAPDLSAELFHAVSRGDEAAFTTFCVQALPPLLHTLSRRCRDFSLPADFAQDAAQEALARGLRHLAQDPAHTISLPWLVTVGTRWLCDRARQQRRQRSAGAAGLEELPAPPSREHPSPEQLEQVMGGLERLEPEDRDILQLVLIQEVPVAEAAGQLRLGLSTAYKRYRRALANLRQLLEAEERKEGPLPILRQLERLAAQDREILELILVHGMTFPDAAAKLRIGLSTAYKRYHRALQRWQALLDADEAAPEDSAG